MEVFKWNRALKELKNLLRKQLEANPNLSVEERSAIMLEAYEITNTKGYITPNVFVPPNEADYLLRSLVQGQQDYRPEYDNEAFVSSVVQAAFNQPDDDTATAILEAVSDTSLGPLHTLLPSSVNRRGVVMDLLQRVARDGFVSWGADYMNEIWDAISYELGIDFTDQLTEVNPFEDETIATEWIEVVEGEKGLVRDNEIYPRVRQFAEQKPMGTIVEIGSGQGVCASKLGEHAGTYTGFEPSVHLRKRAIELYGQSLTRSFLPGNAYTLPVETGSVDQIFSVGLWFHLANIETAAREMARALMPGGTFFIVTSNDKSHQVWKSMFNEYTINGNLISGEIKTLSGTISRSDFYCYSEKESVSALRRAGLRVSKTELFGETDEYPGVPLMCGIYGSK